MSQSPKKSYTKADDGARITPEGISRMRARIGVEIPKKPYQTWNEYTTADAIRHFAYGYGDDNPLWVDSEYATNSRWRSIIAPPTFLYSTGITDKLEISADERKKGGGALKGIHAFWSGDEIEFFRPTFPGDRLVEQRYVYDVQEKNSEFGGISVLTTDRTLYTNNRGELVAIWDKLFVRAERKTSAKRKKYGELKKQTYSEADLSAIEAEYDKEIRRGATPRFWEDVHIGEEIPHVIHGPLVMSDEIAWHQGNGRWEIFPHKVGLDVRRKHPGFYSLNEIGVPEAVMRCHWDDSFARKIGNPFAYDNGIMRSSWMVHVVTNWMGDDAWIWKVKDRIRQFNYFGDTTWVTGTIHKKYQHLENDVVDIEIKCTDQRGRITATAITSVLLPSKTGGPVLLPRAPRGWEGRLPGSPPVTQGYEL